MSYMLSKFYFYKYFIGLNENVKNNSSDDRSYTMII